MSTRLRYIHLRDLLTGSDPNVVAFISNFEVECRLLTMWKKINFLAGRLIFLDNVLAWRRRYPSMVRASDFRLLVSVANIQ